MKILVCGSGPLGSLFAAHLRQGGHDVTLLPARRNRLTLHSALPRTPVLAAPVQV